jgi:hypothetical protein
MSAILENILKEPEELTAQESLILLTRLSQHLQRKGLTELGKASVADPVGDQVGRVRLAHAYHRTPEEIEANLAAIFTPEEVALIGKTDFTKFNIGPKSLSQTLNEDREDRF